MKKYVIIEAPSGKESAVGKTLEIDMPKTTHNVTLSVTSEVRSLFKAQSALEGQSMNSLMVSLIEDYIKQN